MDLSIIIPVYNTEMYLEECVNSVLEQIEFDLTGQKVEIIFVNDGSKDNSLKILQNYKETQNNIVIIDKENAGLAAARNSGIEVASGEFILFLDSDDYLFKHIKSDNEIDYKGSCIKVLLETARNKCLDILCYNYTRKKDNTPERRAKNGAIFDTDFLVQNNIYTSSACTKLIKKSILIDNSIYFKNGTLSEDILFCAKLLEVDNVKIGFLNEVIYFYRQREGSITNSINLKHIDDILFIIKTLKQSKNNNVLCYAAFQYATLLININLSDKEISEANWAQIYELSYLLKYNKSLIIRAIKFVASLVGIKNTSKIMAVAFKMKRRLNK